MNGKSLYLAVILVAALSAAAGVLLWRAINATPDMAQDTLLV